MWTTTEKGFGSAVLEQVMAEHFEVPPQVQFPPGGVIYELNGSLDTLAQTNEYCSAEDARDSENPSEDSGRADRH